MPAHIIEQPSGEPVSLEEAKAQCSIESDDDDELLGLIISAARQHVEAYCNRGILQQTWELVTDSFPVVCSPGARDYLELPRGHLAELDDDASPVTSVKYIDGSGVEQTMDAADYSVDAVNVPGRVRLGFGKTWPTTRSPQWDAVKVVYVVGWAEDEVPESLKQALLLLVSQMFEHRTPEITGTIAAKIQFSFEALLAPHRLYFL